MRLTGGYLRDRFRPFYGIGNAPSVAPTSDPRWGEHYYAFDLTGWNVWAALERTLSPALKLTLQYQLSFESVRPFAGSLLEQQPPVGAGGGRTSMVELLVAYDTRDAEASPTRGVQLELGARASHAAVGSQFAFAGAVAIARGWHSFFDQPWLVLAGRLAADALVGEVPISQLPPFGGRSYLDGLGGANSLRGVPLYRAVGKVKLLANLELRSRVVRLRPFDRSLDLWLVAFGDAGRVWAEFAPEGSPLDLHLSGGGGVRLGWVEDYVIRFDVGFSRYGRGLYLTFSQMF